jgi:ribosomal protein S13
MSETLIIPKEEYDLLKNKADLFDRYIEVEELSDKELKQIKKAMKSSFLTKSEFIRRHPELN